MLTSLPLPYHNKRSPAHSGDELPFLGDELQNRGRAPHPQGAGAGGNTKAAAFCQARGPCDGENLRADASIGPYAEGRHPQGVRRAAVPGLAAGMPCIVGRAFTPAGEVCATPEGYWHGKVPHPSAAWGDTSPCRGGFIGGSPPKASPARGGGCAARRRRRGALPVSGKNILQGPAGPCPASVGDDACIVPETLRWRKPQARAKTPALHCGHKQVPARKRQPSVRPAGGPMQASAPTQRGGIRRACGGLPFPVSPPVCLAL